MQKKILLSAIAIFGFAIISMAQVPSYIPTDSLIAWWPFTGNAIDSSGNGNNGTVNGATLTTDRFGNLNSRMDLMGTTIKRLGILCLNLDWEYTLVCELSNSLKIR
jgi:hypothetical protein